MSVSSDWPYSTRFTDFLARFGVEAYSTVVRMDCPQRTGESSRTGNAFILSLGRYTFKGNQFRYLRIDTIHLFFKITIYLNKIIKQMLFHSLNTSWNKSNTKSLKLLIVPNDRLIKLKRHPSCIADVGSTCQSSNCLVPTVWHMGTSFTFHRCRYWKLAIVT